MASRDVLIQAFEAAPDIAGRYKSLYCVNFRPGDIHKVRGGYSLVFRALDSTTGQTVAIKIMDPDHLADLYRMDCFAREPKILAGLQTFHRCLRLVEGHKIFDISVTLTPGVTLPYPVGFFVTEWLAEDIEAFFLRQQSFDALIKLNLYRQVLLAVKVLHDQQTHHRDLKRDNFRVRVTECDLPVIAIDFGTAAKLASPHAAPTYGTPVGHYGYAPPEAFAGLAGVREIGALADIYALAGLLYELFKPNLFFTETVANPVFVMTLSAALHKSNTEPDVSRRLVLWRRVVKDFARAVQPPSLLGPGSTIPDAVRPQLVALYSDMAAFDLGKRLSDFNIILRRLDGAIRCLGNQAFRDREQKQRRQERLDRLKRYQAKEARLHAKYGTAVQGRLNPNA
jgi:serine/threonine protein kinase